MTQIVTGLYLGDYEDASKQSRLTERNITHIVNCAKEHKNYFPNEYMYLTLNLDDSEQQVIYDRLEKSFNFIKKALDNGGSVLVHCHAGISRSASIVIYYLMKVTKSPYDRIYSFVKSKRAQVSPNKGFVMQLISVTPQVITIQSKQALPMTYERVPLRDMESGPSIYAQQRPIESRAVLLKKFNTGMY